MFKPGSLRAFLTAANPELARKIAHWLASEPGRAEVFEFANENIFVKILDNAREKDVFIVQPTSRPVSSSIMELLIMIDAFKRASAGRITAVIPYYGYARQDRRPRSTRVPSSRCRAAARPSSSSPAAFSRSNSRPSHVGICTPL